MHSIEKSITLMLMKVGKLLSHRISFAIAAIVILFTHTALAAVPTDSPTKPGETETSTVQYIYVYDKADKAAIEKDGKESKHGSDSAVNGLQIFAKGGPFGETPAPTAKNFDWKKVNDGGFYVYQGHYTCSGYNLEYQAQINLNDGLQSPKEGINVWYTAIEGKGKKQTNPEGALQLPDSALKGVPSDCLLPNRNDGSFSKIRATDYNSLSAAEKAKWPGVSSADATPADGGGDAADPEKGCTTSGGMGWYICGLINFFGEFTDWVEEKLIEPLFETQPLSFDISPENPQYAGWSAMRTIANVFFVLLFIGVIFGNLLSIEAYNIKKMLPKMVVAVILIQVSYVLMAAAIDVTNILGKGLKEILESLMPAASYPGGKVGAGGIVTTLGAGLLIGLAFTAKIKAVGIFAAALPMVIGVFFVMMTLVLRQTLIVMLILTAPIAIAAMTLPNTEKLFRTWSNLFIKILLMYPLIILLFAAGKMAAFAALATSGSPVLVAVAPVVAMLCMAVPLIAVPFTFGFAGGLMAKASSATLKAGGGVQKGVMGSDFMKNKVEERKRRAYEAADPSASVGLFGTARALKNGRFNVLNPRTRLNNARAGGGFFRTTASAARRIGEQKDKVYSADEKALGRQFEAVSSRMNSDEKKNLLQEIATGEASGFQKDTSAKKFAIKKLAQMKGFEEIRNVRNAASGSDRQVIDGAISDAFGDVHKAAPDLTVGFGYFDNMSISDVKELDASTIDRYVNDPTANQAEKDRRQERLGQLIESVSKSDPQKAQVNGKLLGKFRHLAVNNQLGNHSQHVRNVTEDVLDANNKVTGARFK